MPKRAKDAVLWEHATQKEKIARVEHLLKIMTDMTPHERKKHFAMEAWGYHTPCGTVACVAGHAALNPWFRKRGFSGDVHFDSGLFKEALAEWKDEVAKGNKLVGNKPDKDDLDFWGEFNFEGVQPFEFFGDLIEDQIFMRSSDSFGEVKNRVKGVLRQLKQGVEL